MPTFENPENLKKGDWVRLQSDRNGGWHLVPNGYVGVIVSLNANNTGKINVRLKFDNNGNRPNCVRTGSYVWALPAHVHPLLDLEVLGFVGRELL